MFPPLRFVWLEYVSHEGMKYFRLATEEVLRLLLPRYEFLFVPQSHGWISLFYLWCIENASTWWPQLISSCETIHTIDYVRQWREFQQERSEKTFEWEWCEDHVRSFWFVVEPTPRVTTTYELWRPHDDLGKSVRASVCIPGTDGLFSPHDEYESHNVLYLPPTRVVCTVQFWACGTIPPYLH